MSHSTVNKKCGGPLLERDFRQCAAQESNLEPTD